MPGDSMGNGFDFSELTELIKQIESMGADMDKIAEHVLDAGSEPARKAFQNNVPYDTTTPEGQRRHPHARDNVIVYRTQHAKRSGNKYRLIGADDGKTVKYKRRRQPQKEGSKRKRRTTGNSREVEGSTFDYLWMVENGSTKATAQPFVEKAYREARDASNGPMKDAFIQEIENHLR